MEDNLKHLSLKGKNALEYMLSDRNPKKNRPTPYIAYIDENLNADLLINAPEKIKTFVVTVDSPQLSPTIAALCSYADTYVEGEPADMDMIGDAVLVENLANMNLGLPLADEIAGQTTVPFSLSGLVPLINLYGPEAGTEHKFTLKVTDEKGQSMEQMVVFVTAE